MNIFLAAANVDLSAQADVKVDGDKKKKEKKDKKKKKKGFFDKVGDMFDGSSSSSSSSSSSDSSDDEGDKKVKIIKYCYIVSIIFFCRVSYLISFICTNTHVRLTTIF